MKRKTNEEFQQEVFSLVGDEYTFLDKYVNAKDKIKVKHNKCGNIYEVQPNNFIHGKRCPYCFGTPKKTDEQFKKEVYNLVGNEYVFMGQYQGKGTKIKVKHDECGNTYEVTPHSFLQGNRCPYCSGLVQKTDEQFKQEVYNLVGDSYIFLDSYVNTRTKIRVKHNKCGNVYLVSPSKFLTGRRCPYCAGLAKKTDKQFRQEVFDLVGDTYVFLDSYVNSHIKIRVKHNKCNHVYSVSPTNFIRGSRCPYCNGNARKTNKQFKQEIYELVGNEYTFLEDYRGNETKIKVKHNKCGKIYEVKPSNFLYVKRRCPYCNSPKGELIINKMLKSLGINYETQKTFDDLKDTKLLSYDFYIPSQNILIEYQGIQHYEPINIFGGEDKFKAQQKHDQMKLEYAKEHGYNLIAIPYMEDTLYKIKKYLINHGLK